MQIIWAIEKYEKRDMRFINSWLYLSEEIARAELPQRVKGCEPVPDEPEEWESEKHLFRLVKRRIYETAQEARDEREAGQKYLAEVRSYRQETSSR